MGVKIIPEHLQINIPNDVTNNKGKTESADAPLWKYNHIKAFSTSPKEQLLPSAVGQNDAETSTSTTGSHRNFNIRHSMLFPLLPCANLPHFREHIMVS